MASSAHGIVEEVVIDIEATKKRAKVTLKMTAILSVYIIKAATMFMILKKKASVRDEVVDLLLAVLQLINIKWA